MVLTATTHAAPLNKQEPHSVADGHTQQVQPVKERPAKPKKVKRAAKPKPVKKVKVRPNYPKGCEAYRKLVARYNWNVNVALQVMRAESGCNPNAVGDTHLTYFQNGIRYGMSCGMFQVRFLPGRPTCSDMQVPAKNIAYAYGLYRSGGWGHWSVCNKGIVSCY